MNGSDVRQFVHLALRQAQGEWMMFYNIAKNAHPLKSKVMLCYRQYMISPATPTAMV